MKLFIHYFSFTEITPCESNIKCGHGCIATEHGPMCVCPEDSILQENGHACTGTDIMTPVTSSLTTLFSLFVERFTYQGMF